jgi:hypothetical protein
MLNESVLQVINSNAWRVKTLVESANQGTFFTISESEFQRLLEKEQIDEGLKDLLQKAKAAAAKLPGNIQQATQAVKNAAEKASLNVGSLYQKAQDQLDKIPLVGKIPPQTRNRLIMGLALSMVGSMVGAHAADGGQMQDTGGFDPGQHSDPGAFAPDQAVGGDQGGGAEGGGGGGEGGGGKGDEVPTPNSDLQTALNSSKGKIIDHANDKNGMTRYQIDSAIDNVSSGKMSVKDAQELLNKQPGISKTPQSQSVLQDLLAKAAKVAQADGKKAPEGQGGVDQVAAAAPNSATATTPATNTHGNVPLSQGGIEKVDTPDDFVAKHGSKDDHIRFDQGTWVKKGGDRVANGTPVPAVVDIITKKFPDLDPKALGEFLQSKVPRK